MTSFSFNMAVEYFVAYGGTSLWLLDPPAPQHFLPRMMLTDLVLDLSMQKAAVWLDILQPENLYLRSLQISEVNEVVFQKIQHSESIKKIYISFTEHEIDESFIVFKHLVSVVEEKNCSIYFDSFDLCSFEF